MDETVCVIIPAQGAAPYLAQCVASVFSQQRTPDELILVDDGIDPKVLEPLRQYQEGLRVLKSDGAGPSAARNLAAQSTSAQFIAFTDSDCSVDKRWLAELLDGFRQYPEAAGGGGSQEVPPDASIFERRVFSFMRKTGMLTEYVRRGRPDELALVGHNASCNAIYKRGVFLQEGSFLNELWPGEDVELDYRLRKKGYQLFYNPRSVVYHHKPRSWRAFAAMMYRYGRAQGILVRRHGFFRRIQLVCPVALLYLVFCVLSPVFALSLVALGVLAAAIYLRSVRSLGLLLVTLVCWNFGFIAGAAGRPSLQAQEARAGQEKR